MIIWLMPLKQREIELRRLARAMTVQALYFKKIVRPDICSACGAGPPIQGHHPNYAEPLNIEWLCVGCHIDRHRVLKKRAKEKRKLQSRPVSIPKGMVQFLTVENLMDLYGVSRKTIVSSMESGLLCYIKIGHTIRFDPGRIPESL